MKQLITFCTLFLVLISYGQDITGNWHGKLAIAGQELRIVFHISKDGSTYSSTLDSPDQGAKGIPTSSTSFTEKTLTIHIDALSATYTGSYSNNQFEGTFTQSGNALPLNLGREALEKPTLNRPQEPIGKVDYKQKEVRFTNAADNVVLGGELTYPKGKGPFPVAVLVSGSGPQNRNEELLGHKPFLVIADYLTEHGIAVLRYDDRGVASSTGTFATATSEDFARDADAAVKFLQTQPMIDPDHIGIIGHSEGGMIAPMVAASNPDIAFIITLAGPGVPCKTILIEQQELIARAEGISEKDIRDSRMINEALYAFLIEHDGESNIKEGAAHLIDSLATEYQIELPEGMSLESLINKELKSVTTPWMRYFLRFDPAPYLQKVACPVLALNGEKDLQVPSKSNLAAIEKGVRSNGNQHVTVREFENLNHLFQHCSTGAPSEYAKIEETFSEEVLELMASWINGLQTTQAKK